MYLSRLVIRLISKPSIYSSFYKVSSASVFKAGQVQNYCSNVKEAIKTNEKLIDSLTKAQEAEKTVKRNELTCDSLIQLMDSGNATVIDVRDKVDIEKSGIIPGAIHIPLNKLKSSLKLSNEEFLAVFSRQKPDYQCDSIVFYGQKEIKSTSACEIAYSLGYKKSRSLIGGFTEWCDKGLKIYKVETKDV